MPPASGATLAPGTVASPTRVSRTARRAGRLLGRIDLLTDRIRPWMVLAPLVFLGWGVMAYVAHAAVHDGWYYYDSGDGTWYYTTAWQLAHGRIPISAIGYGYPMFLAPVVRLGGANLLGGVPYVIALNAVVLGPIALLCVYGLAKQLGGQRFAYLVSGIWVAAPLLAIPYFLADYHRRYVGLTLPAVLGLTPLGDFPSMVALLVAAYFAFRAIGGGRDSDALTAGLAAGLALAVKPANAIFLPAPFLALLLARRPRAFLVLAGGLIPAVVCLTVWKYRGLGYLPLFKQSRQALAAGAGLPPLGLGIHLGKYLPFDWGRLWHDVDGFREFTWSRRLIEWAIIGGLLGLARRSIAGAALIGIWLASFFVIKGSTVADFYGGGFFRYMAPAFPAAFLLAMSLPFLTPIYGRRLARCGDSSGWPSSPGQRRGVVRAGLLLSVLPLVPLLAFPTQSVPSATTLQMVDLFVPANQFALTGTAHGRSVKLEWPDESAGAPRVKYGIYRAPSDQLGCTRPSGGAIFCSYPSEPAVIVPTTHWTDRPGPGRWVYRVTVLAAPVPPAGSGNHVLLSRPLTVNVSR